MISECIGGGWGQVSFRAVVDDIPSLTNSPKPVQTSGIPHAVPHKRHTTWTKSASLPPRFGT